MPQVAFLTFRLKGDCYSDSGSGYADYAEARRAIESHFRLNGHLSGPLNWHEQPDLVFTEFRGEDESAIIQIAPDKERAATMAVATYKILKRFHPDRVAAAGGADGVGI